LTRHAAENSTIFGRPTTFDATQPTGWWIRSNPFPQMPIRWNLFAVALSTLRKDPLTLASQPTEARAQTPAKSWRGSADLAGPAKVDAKHPPRMTNGIKTRDHDPAYNTRIIAVVFNIRHAHTKLGQKITRFRHEWNAYCRAPCCGVPINFAAARDRFCRKRGQLQCLRQHH